MARASLEQAPGFFDALGPSVPKVSRWRQESIPEADIGDSTDGSAALAPSTYVLPRLLPGSADVEANERPPEAIDPLQSWEGVVLDAGDSTFSVRLVDVAGDHPDEEVTVAKE